MSGSHWRDGAYLECRPSALMALIDTEAERLDPGHLSRVADESRINDDRISDKCGRPPARFDKEAEE